MSRKFTLGVFASCNTQSYSYQNNWYVYNPAVTGGIRAGDWLVDCTFSGSILHLGVAAYYQMIDRRHFIFSPGLKLCTNLYTKAHADYATNYVHDFNATDSIKTLHSTNDFFGLKSRGLSMVYLRLVTRLEFPVYKPFSFYIEPGISLFGSRTNDFSWFYMKDFIFNNFGFNAGILWKFKGKEHVKNS